MITMIIVTCYISILLPKIIPITIVITNFYYHYYNISMSHQHPLAIVLCTTPITNFDLELTAFSCEMNRANGQHCLRYDSMQQY